MIVYGSKISYFTGKFEAYLRYKEIPYEFRALGLGHYGWVIPRKLGATQLPSVLLADGRWMSDTTPMIAWLEQRHPEFSVMPEDPVQRFVSLLVEDYADEWLWRPAMHYRWSYLADRHLAGTRLAQELIRAPLPLSVRRAYVSRRQRRLFVRGDGITRRTRDHAEGVVSVLIARLQAIFSERSFLLGERPTVADIGLMGPVWRHLLHDPTPARIVQEDAPSLFEWAARMWNARGSRLTGAELLNGVPDDLSPLLRDIGASHLEALAVNAEAHRERRLRHDLTLQGVTYRNIPTSPYRVWCAAELRRRFAELGDDEAESVRVLLGEHGCWEPMWRVEQLFSGHDLAGEAPFSRVTRMVRD